MAFHLELQFCHSCDDKTNKTTQVSTYWSEKNSSVHLLDVNFFQLLPAEPVIDLSGIFPEQLLVLSSQTKIKTEEVHWY